MHPPPFLQNAEEKSTSSRVRQGQSSSRRESRPALCSPGLIHFPAMHRRLMQTGISGCKKSPSNHSREMRSLNCWFCPSPPMVYSPAIFSYWTFEGKSCQLAITRLQTSDIPCHSAVLFKSLSSPSFASTRANRENELVILIRSPSIYPYYFGCHPSQHEYLISPIRPVLISFMCWVARWSCS